MAIVFYGKTAPMSKRWTAPAARPARRPITLLKEQGDESDLFLLHRYQFSPLLLAQLVKLFLQVADFDLRLQVDLVLVCRIDPVFRRLAVLCHHDNGRLEGGGHGQHQIKQNVRIRVEGIAAPGQTTQ